MSTTWKNYRTGVPRDPCALQRLARHRGAKLGYRLHRSRRRTGPDNAGGFVLVDKDGRVALGAGYSTTVEAILDLLEREQVQSKQAATDLRTYEQGYETIRHTNPRKNH